MITLLTVLMFWGLGGTTERSDEGAGNCKRVMRNTLLCFLLPYLIAFQLNQSAM